MNITVYGRDRFTLSDSLNNWETLSDHGFHSGWLTVHEANGKTKLKFDVVHINGNTLRDRQWFGFTKTLKGKLDDLTHKNPVLETAINIDKQLTLTKVNNMLDVIADIKQNFDVKPVNGDLIVTESGSVGLVIDGTVFVATSSTCTQYKLSPFVHVISRQTATRVFGPLIARIMADVLRRYHINFNHLVDQLPVGKHKPGFVYLNPKNTVEAYVYMGNGILTDINDLDSKRGHLYVRIPIKRLTEADLRYGKPAYTMTDLNALVHQLVDGNTVQIDVENHQSFVRYANFNNPLELTKNVRSIQLLELGQLVNPDDQLSIATADGTVNWLFMPGK